MSDKKISDLVELATLAADDVLPVVDASANATKRITGANLSSGIRGDIVSGDLPAGSIVQVVQGSTSTEVEIATTSHVDTTLSASITPTSADNKILAIYSQNFQLIRDTTFQRSNIQLRRDGATINTVQLTVSLGDITSMVIDESVTRSVWDSPNTTSSVTYATFADAFSTSNNGKITVNDGNFSATLTLFEVVA